MNVNAFITMYNQRMRKNREYTQELITATVSELVKPKLYLSYDDKLNLIDRVISSSAGSKHLTADRYRYFIIELIKAYTVLEMNEEQFDVLSENKLLDIILSTFDYEYKVCTNLMQMCLKDLEGG